MASAGPSPGRGRDTEGRDRDQAADERDRIADEREIAFQMREGLAEERERLADERERLADERDAIASERDADAAARDRAADERDRIADQEEIDIETGKSRRQGGTRPTPWDATALTLAERHEELALQFATVEDAIADTLERIARRGGPEAERRLAAAAEARDRAARERESARRFLPD